MSEHHAEIIVIKKKIVRGGGHHGGAWKIAFADFMTAMMAFFLVLWIINATDKDTRTVIARYFNPVKLENSARATKGVHGVDATKIVSNETTGDQAPDREPGGESSSGKKERAVGPAAAPPEGAPAKQDTKPKTPSAAPHPDPRDATDVRPTMTETALFSDPYKALDKIAGGRSSDSPAPAPDTGDDGPARAAGANSLEAFRDPFKPIGPGAQTDSVSLDADAPPSPLPDQKPDLTPQKGELSMSAPTGVAGVEATVPPNEKPPPAPAATPETKDGAAAPAHSSTDLTSAGQPHAPASAKDSDLMKDLQRQLGPLEKSEKGPAIDIEATKEGLLISLTDKLNFSMFAVGSAEPRAEVVKAMDTIAGVIKSHAEQLVVRGHTDGRPYKTALYDNWRLSSARAQMAYYMLTRAGVPEGQFQRIEGHADHALRDPAHPLAAENRRVEILIRETKP